MPPIALSHFFPLPRDWPRRVRSAVVQVVFLARTSLALTQGWSLAQTARVFLVTPLTIASWMGRLDEQGPDALVRLPEPAPDHLEIVVPNPISQFPNGPKWPT